MLSLQCQSNQKGQPIKAYQQHTQKSQTILMQYLFELNSHIKMKHLNSKNDQMMQNKRLAQDADIDYDKEVLKSFLNKFIQCHQKEFF
ncbi:UNKNOWN [Stylonychia lemnae]|uniref:Uncharacterized protein n=1 Tax=Stylonychia lemnae TaxID=5949 RepID=A0A078B4S1_STYLE|nr:UNKNOWN [Stylonychia lemnae]|eukprot:CDW89530.1 UNKNOWN [Stylonychia lemnae]